MEVFVAYKLTVRPRAPKGGRLYTMGTQASLDLLQVGEVGGGGGDEGLFSKSRAGQLKINTNMMWLLYVVSSCRGVNHLPVIFWREGLGKLK